MLPSPRSTVGKGLASSFRSFQFLEHCCHCIVVSATVVELHEVVGSIPYRHHYYRTTRASGSRRH
ncbi:uncharacterized protein DS421_2g44310 [Arachis hypogaea]|nr:uncharacterized protein DS421_2g44310 [Arachis hypogaea]